MNEKPFYFGNGSKRLFAMLHEPAAAASARTPFVFCHAFAEEKLWAQRVFVSFARRLATEGHTVLRFDYMGNGDSDGDFTESSLNTARSDVRCAIDHLKAETGARAVSLLGLRLGASVASLVAEEASDIDQLILWAPIVDGARYMQELLRINLTTQMAVYKEIRQDREALVEAMRQGSTINVDGYDIALPLYSEVSAIRLAAETKRHEGPCLIVQIERQSTRPAAELQKLAASYRRSTLVLAEEEPFWKEILRFYGEAPDLFAKTSEWQRTLATLEAPGAIPR